MSVFKGVISRLAVTLPICMLLIFSCASARATYPGRNGRIAFVGNFGQTFQLYTVKPDGTDLFQVTNLPATDFWDWAPSYSPDGHSIVFCHDVAGSIELYTVNTDGTGLKQITNDGAENLFPQWSPDGSRILFSAQFIDDRFDYHHLATISAEGTDRQLLTNTLFDDYQARYSSDGAHIIFASTRENLISALWMMDANGEHPRRITEARLEGGGPDPSPDGRHIVFFNQGNTERPSSVVISDIHGNYIRVLAPPAQTFNASYSPEGNKIVFSHAISEDQPFNVYVMNPDGSNSREVIACAGGCFDPSWGPEERNP